MMRAVILDGDSLGTDLTLDEFSALPIELIRYPATTPAQVDERIRDADIVLVNKVVLNADSLCQAAQLKYVGVLATGTNNVDTDYCQQHNIVVKNVDGYGTDSVAQHAMMLLLNLATSFVPTRQQVKQGDWSRSPFFCLLDNPVMELAGKHLVIVGYGTLGQRFAELARAFGMRVSVAARPGTDAPDRQPLDTLLPEADVLSLHCQLSPQTEKMMNAERLALMKSSALLINTARGGLIDEAALVSALNNGVIAGAALDTLSVEPPPSDHPLLNADLPNLLITPHSAWSAKDARQRLVQIAADRLNAFIAAG
ncbi:D-2-hydroxyacid dehydrogenase [Alteromonas lipolytica]|uniref:Glycerate dehydrogenase n=1 Tax=Alteromonas lipolytica TaxID=1856405 RepID=A0A1E8FAM7_9ALTE|nr:D-2-hydroxyacid dehydrogenase [Alteromonas lipolytica]OFI32960.1 glycerate dehydrogenase [Alteromonas lipolytica]GGF63882.1 glycerate dehydrogenase [Alteromonas lipolytica]